MAARRPFCKWHRWKSIGFCLWPPSTCIWNLKLKFQSKLDLCSGNHVVYRQTDGQTDRRTDGRTRWIQYTPPPTSLGGGIKIHNICLCFLVFVVCFSSVCEAILKDTAWPLLLTWISNYIYYEMWDGITYPFPNFNGAAFEVWEWISYFISHFTEHVITYPCRWD